MRQFLATAITILLVLNAQTQDLREVYNDGMTAYKNGEFKVFLDKMKLADSLSPMHQTIVYNLASAYAKNDMTVEAVETLKVAININAGFEPEKDEDFSGVDITEVLKLKAKLNSEIKSSQLAFTNPELDLHPESVAFDPQSGHFFLNSVRKGKMVRYDPKANKFYTLIEGRWAVMGMKVQDGFLWACEVATSQHAAFKEEDQGKTALLKIELKTGKLAGRWELEGGHWFGDVTFSKSGQPYISDSMKPMIYTLENDQLKVFKDFTGELFNLQGLTFNEEETALYIADYKIGIHRFDLKTGKVQPISEKNYLTKGTDGLYFHENSLIAIQNGVRPFRISKIMLNNLGLMEDITYLDKARIEFNEPTLGVLVDDQLYYIANSPWGAYKDGELQTEGLEKNLVMKVKLNRSAK